MTFSIKKSIFLQIQYKMGKYDFKKDIITGQNGENIIREHILNITGAKLIEINHDKKFDFMIEKDGVKKTYEVKTEEYCRPGSDNGNLFIEIECRGQASGIMATMSDWYVFYLPYRKQIWYIPTDDLKALVIENQFRKTENSGDKGSNTTGYLIPRRKYKQHFKVYDL